MVICQGWPCWLTSALMLGLPVVDVFCPQRYQGLFLSAGSNLENVVFHDLVIFRGLVISQDRWVLASGDIEFFATVQAKMQWYQACFLYSVDVRFERYPPRDLLRHYERWARDHACMGLGLSIVRHANCGGVNLAAHYDCFGNIFNKPTIYVPCVPRIFSLQLPGCSASGGVPVAC